LTGEERQAELGSVPSGKGVLEISRETAPWEGTCVRRRALTRSDPSRKIRTARQRAWRRPRNRLGTKGADMYWEGRDTGVTPPKRRSSQSLERGEKSVGDTGRKLSRAKGKLEKSLKAGGNCLGRQRWISGQKGKMLEPLLGRRYKEYRPNVSLLNLRDCSRWGMKGVKG